MTPEEKIKDFKGAKLIYYRVVTVAINFEDFSGPADFKEWLDNNGYDSYISSSDRVEFTKIPIHQHRLHDYKKYPNLLIKGSEVTR